MNSPVGKNMKEEKEERRGKNNIRLVSIVTDKFGELDNNKRVVISKWLRKETLVCVQYMLGMKIFELVLSMGKINR